MNDSFPLTNIQRILLVALSAVAWFFTNHLSGEFGWLLWVAPLPLLILAFQSTAKQTFYFVLLAYLIGRLSWLGYLLRLLPIPLAIFFTVLLPLIYALIFIGVHK